MTNSFTPTLAQPLRLGVVGLGRAFTLMLPTFLADTRVQLVAATDPREEACAQFRADFGAPTYTSVEALCADPQVEVVYIATPHQMHAEHVRVAALHGKHVLVEKPLGITLEQCRAMVEATRAAGVYLIVGHSHSFDAPILRARGLIEGGTLGAVRMINAQYFTDFLYRPRRPEELDTGQGGGVLFSQAAHQIDIVRMLAGGMATTVRAHTGAWDPARGVAGGRPAEGAYSALIGFEGGAFASVTYSGYGHYDSDELCDWIGELGVPKDPAHYQSGPARLRSVESAAAEAQAKAARNYGGSTYVAAAAGGTAPHHQHFGHVLISCEHGDIRPGPRALTLYGNAGRTVETLPTPAIARVEVIDELVAAVVAGVAPLHDGAWSLATMEVCLAMLESARLGRDISLHYQVPVRQLSASPLPAP